VLALALVVAPSGLEAQRGWDVQLHTQLLARDSLLAAVGAGAGLRLGGGLRAAATASWGWLAPDRTAGRLELVGAYHLPPLHPTHPSVYVSGGLAVEASGDDLRGLLLVALGVEARPWGGGGWFAELGVGGGVRVALGLRRITLKRGP
jgi:hypothetical protein